MKTLRVTGKKKKATDGSETESAEEASDDGVPPTRRLASMSSSEVINELQLMQQLATHPNIVTIREFFTEPWQRSQHAGLIGDGDGEEEEEDVSVVHVVMDLLRGAWKKSQSQSQSQSQPHFCRVFS